MTANDEYILEILESVGLITHEQGRNALTLSNMEEMDVVDVLVRDEGLVKTDILKALASQFGMETVTLKGVEVPREILDLVPVEVIMRYKTIPLYLHDDTLVVAISDPLDVETLDSIGYVLKRNVEGVVATAEVANALGVTGSLPACPAWVTAWIDADAVRPWPP